jgi:peptidoglycan/xylan/chitin deacetylase (PgdA/CDA1 family)
MKKRLWFISILCSFLFVIVISLALWLPTKYQVPILMYHSIATAWHEPLNNVNLEHFNRQMAYLKQKGYKVISLVQLVDEIKSGRGHDRKSVVITFDDGYENNYTAAYPVLKKHGFPATIFVEVAHLDHPGRLTWVQAKEMDADGISIESHVMTGAYLPGLSHEQAWGEITQSKKNLQMRLGHPVRFLAYPTGGFSEDIKKIVAQAGYDAAFATNRGYDRDVRDLYEIKRIRMKNSDDDPQMWLKVSGYYNLIRKSKNPF